MHMSPPCIRLFASFETWFSDKTFWSSATRQTDKSDAYEPIMHKHKHAQKGVYISFYGGNAVLIPSWSMHCPRLFSLLDEESNHHMYSLVVMEGF